jgi:hypothetical protein
LISIIFTACEKPIKTLVVPTPPPGPSQTWIDAPLPNSNLPLQPYNLVFHGASFVGITEFEIEINGTVEAIVPPISTSSGGAQYGTLFMSEHKWDPPAPGTYLIQVRAKGNGSLSPPDQVQVIISDSDFESDNTTPPIKVNKECSYTALINQFCRQGPGSGFTEIDNFVPEQTASVIGQSIDGFFWYVIGPNYGEVCTVPVDDGFGEVSGDCEILPLFTPMPEESPEGCTVRQAGGEIICVSPCPDGAAPGNPCTP